MNDPNTGGAFTRYNFNLNNPLAGDPKKENATGLLMRSLQYMVQVVGVDGFRVDAARHMPSFEQRAVLCHQAQRFAGAQR